MIVKIKAAGEVFMGINFFVKVFEVKSEFFFLPVCKIGCIEGVEECGYFESAEGFYCGVEVQGELFEE